jgi:hypothetical protein
VSKPELSPTRNAILAYTKWRQQRKLEQLRRGRRVMVETRLPEDEIKACEERWNALKHDVPEPPRKYR